MLRRSGEAAAEPPGMHDHPPRGKTLLQVCYTIERDKQVPRGFLFRFLEGLRRMVKPG